MNNKIIDLHKASVMNTYTRAPIVMERGQGSYLFDSEGKKYLDFFPGFGVGVIGHAHPAIADAISKQATKLIHLSNTLYNSLQAEFAARISALTNSGKCFFANSGAEANEAAIKFARQFGSQTGRNEIITFKNSFHGRTYASMSATGQAKFHKGFEPLLPGFSYAEFNSMDSVREKMSGKTVAVLIEIVQGEGGINLAEKSFIEELFKLCKDKDILFMVDEVQTGFGRTGKYFAYQHFDIEPDIVTLAKAIGGGLPMGAMVVRRDLCDIFKPGMHASTFGGSPIVCAAGLAMLDVIENEHLIEQIPGKSEHMAAKLEEIKSGCSRIDRIEGKGLMWGVKFKDNCADVVSECLEHGLIINCTAGSVLRMLPAINVSLEEIDMMAAILNKVLTGKEK